MAQAETRKLIHEGTGSAQSGDPYSPGPRSWLRCACPRRSRHREVKPSLVDGARRTGRRGGPRLSPSRFDVGEALASYLRRGRPRATDERAVFLRMQAPRGRLSDGGVKHVLRSACDRAGLPRIGSHRLRHSVATQMLQVGLFIPTRQAHLAAYPATHRSHAASAGRCRHHGHRAVARIREREHNDDLPTRRPDHQTTRA
jgi:integrase